MIELPHSERVYSGHLACPGCGAVIAMRFLLKGLGDRVIVAGTAPIPPILSYPRQ